jgi:hypothetical protein
MELKILRTSLGLAMAAGLLLSPKLWLTQRSYPLVPIADWLPAIPAPLDAVLYWLLIALTIVGICSQLAIKVFVVLFFAVSLGDQTRWQPWVYQYFWMLFALGFCSRDSALNACRFILVATYVWSGVQKYNASFTADGFPWVTAPLVELAPPSWQGFLKAQGWTAALAECAIGLMLLIPRLRLAGLALAIILHIGLLVCLGPWGHDWNEIVWPWNAAMIAFDLALFASCRPVSALAILTPSRGTAIVALLFGIMPLASFFGAWDSYLSAALYSGNTIQSSVILDDAALAKLPPEVSALANGREINLSAWTLQELHVPSYPARRVSRGVALKLTELSPSPVILVIEESPDWRTGERAITRETFR